MSTREVVAGLLLAGAGAIAAALRWLRVSQREHYIPGAATRFAGRWWMSSWPNKLVLLLALAATVRSFSRPVAVLGVVTALGFAPVGLGIRGRTSPLAWTRRMRTLAAVAGAFYVAIVAVAVSLGGGVGVGTAAAAAVLVPFLVDTAALALLPLERRLVGRYVQRASERLRQVDPIVVAITGSYGKTTTKEYIRHLLSQKYQVVATPASFNNRAGLARSINEQLASGTEVFVAEMGTYGPGEIAEMCSWVKPKVAGITAIGPVHLERFRSLERTAAAKSEILEWAEVAVLNTDEAHLAPVAERFAQRGRVVACSMTDTTADVCVSRSDGALEIFVGGEPQGTFDERPEFPINVACAIGFAVALDVPLDAILRALPSLPAPAHRRSVVRSANGMTVVDDTYNANPPGARGAVEELIRLARPGSRRVVVTPGMVELGRLQRQANEEFAALAARHATELVVVGRTNRHALVRGARGGNAKVIVVTTRADATEWVRANLRPGDVVLYENDLPDHYP